MGDSIALIRLSQTSVRQETAEDEKGKDRLTEVVYAIELLLLPKDMPMATISVSIEALVESVFDMPFSIVAIVMPHQLFQSARR